jgi:hypothetical protein
MTDNDEQSIPSRGSRGSDITERLRGWARADDSVWPSELMGEAAGEIERLRVNLRLADAGLTLGHPTLTDDEREAMLKAIDIMHPLGWSVTLKNLLGRLE